MRRGSLGQLWLINLGCIAAFLVGSLFWRDAGEASDALPSDVSALKACIASRSVAEDEESYQNRFKLSDHCPNVASALTKIPATELFDKALHDETTLDQLRDIEALSESYNATYRSNQRFDYAGLHNLLASTLVSAPKPRTAWLHELMEWLKQWLKNNLTKKGDHEWRWLTDLLKWVTPSNAIVALMFKGTIILILVLALIVIANEWRASNPSWRLRSRATKLHHVDAPTQRGQAKISWGEVLQLPPRSQATALLRFVIGILIERGLLPNNRSLTNRELLMRLHLEDPAKAEPFRFLMLHAESTLYGDQPIGPTQLQGLCQTADALIGQLVEYENVANISVSYTPGVNG